MHDIAAIGLFACRKILTFHPSFNAQIDGFFEALAVTTWLSVATRHAPSVDMIE